jgi:gamma-glutamyltranspeptidase/glutathione hydrolase/leukotriene-C4 hydrolase
MSRHTIIATIVLIAFIIALGVLLWVSYRRGYEELLSTGAVATTVDECTDAAVYIFEIGGSAADAAITAALCQGLILPQATGIGGGFLATIYIRDKEIVETLNAREVAPLLINHEMYKDNSTLSSEGGLSIAVPTEIRGLWELHQRHGKLSWKEVFQPVINLATNGFKVPSYLGNVLQARESKIRSLSGFKWVEKININYFLIG